MDTRRLLCGGRPRALELGEMQLSKEPVLSESSCFIKRTGSGWGRDKGPLEGCQFSAAELSKESEWLEVWPGKVRRGWHLSKLGTLLTNKEERWGGGRWRSRQKHWVGHTEADKPKLQTGTESSLVRLEQRVWGGVGGKLEAGRSKPYFLGLMEHTYIVISHALFSAFCFSWPEFISQRVNVPT